MHGSRKRLDPHKIPEKQHQPIIGLDVERKPRLSQGRAGVRRKAPPLHIQDQELPNLDQSSLAMGQNL